MDKEKFEYDHRHEKLWELYQSSHRKIRIKTSERTYVYKSTGHDLMEKFVKKLARRDGIKYTKFGIFDNINGPGEHIEMMSDEDYQSWLSSDTSVSGQRDFLSTHDTIYLAYIEDKDIFYKWLNETILPPGEYIVEENNDMAPYEPEEVFYIIKDITHNGKYNHYKISGDSVKVDYTVLDNVDIQQNCKIIQDFIYKVNDSNKITAQTEYESLDEFFSSPITDNIKLDTLMICTTDTKEPIIKLQKVNNDSDNAFKYIVEITSEKGDDFIVRSTIKTQEQLNQLIQQTVEALKQYPQFSKYADTLEDCL